ncbi:peptidoglycan hydrolase [Shewanella sp. OPT22]|nr:peptidoglycan hydrolase [Shewanella sp. OPT22]
MKLENSHGYLNQLSAGDMIKTNGEKGALELVSQQFEAQFLQTVLKQMRQASDVLSDDDSPLSSKSDGMYRDWHDAELAGRLSQMQSTGLAKVMTKQLSAGLQTVQPNVALEKQQTNSAPVSNTTAMQASLISPITNK